VKFLNGYRGKLTGERFYQVGDVAELEDTAAQRLIHQGVAEQVQPDPEAAARSEEPQITHSAAAPSALPRRSKRTGDA
jgi:hypothetical protein